MTMKLLDSRYGGLLLLAAGLLLLPWLAGNAYLLDVANRIAINAIIAVGLNLLIGYAGQISLGHAGFLGLGAYASAILCGSYDWPAWLALLSAAAGVALLAFLVARPILRLKGHYLAMATLGLGMIVSLVLSNESALTGGPDGMAVPGLVLFGWEPQGERAWYWIFATLLLLGQRAAAVAVVLLQALDQCRGRGVALAQAGEQEVVLLRVVQAVGEGVHVVEHHGEQRRFRRGAGGDALAQVFEQAEHALDAGVLVADDAQGFGHHAAPR